MKIINLISDDFSQSALTLKERVLSDFKPEVVIGIATGGAIVVEKMNFTGLPVLVIKRQRPFTKVKGKLNLDCFLPRLPVFINNMLRVLELRFNEIRFKNKGLSENKSTIKLISGDVNSLSTSRNILIVDDAVDSGATFIECVDYIKTLSAEGCNIKTAAINTTFRKPAFIPDYILHSRTIVRYPWANDVRSK